MADNQLVPVREENFALARLQPQSIKELFWFAEQVVQARMFETVKTPQQALILMQTGIELGLSPMQALRELNLINGKVDIPASVRAAKITASPKTTLWEPEANEDYCIIRAKRKDRENECIVTVKKEDLAQAEVNKHRAHLSDWLYARAVRQISRRYFPDLNLGMDEEEETSGRVIDVATVERAVGAEQSIVDCIECGKPSYLKPNRNGGAYSECEEGHRQSPPQVVRDTIRGRTEEFAGETVVDAQAEELQLDEPEDEAPSDENLAQGLVQDEIEHEAAKVDWIAQILEAMKAAQVDGKPSADHRFMLTTRRWDGKEKVRAWLTKQPWDMVEEIRNEMVS